MPPKKKCSRGNSWCDDSTKCLLSIWSDLKAQSQLNSPSKADNAVYSKISNALHDMGYERTRFQCKERMKTLKKSYRQYRDALNKSGQSRRTFKFYKEMNEILEIRPATSPGKVIQSLKPPVSDAEDFDAAADGVDPASEEIEDVIPLLEGEDLDIDVSGIENKDDKSYA
ncbi:zinc finger protein with KRAB and SCAN domains 2-like [Haliotis rubra]|uniref:zinc finger protein with KRAB and SCAN domains 2-like n=1 Tax=Haliotis rubra TaxID=36100 RepID=UPI001EE52477|nr:zinc finger protein with KRAB and SCAN domains 2-like [Haliotis rubra]